MNEGRSSLDRVWRSPPADMALPGDEVHVWRASLDQATPYTNQLAQTLSADELKRAERFHFEQHRQHFIVGRGLLRTILGRYLDLEPGQLRFSYNPQGKPALAEPRAGGLHFNLSHAHGLVLYALTHLGKIGVDLEYLRPGVADEQIAERFFSPQEVSTLRALPKKLQQKAFFTCWTRKEAYIKARGGGLSLPLDQFDVSLAPGEAAALLNTRTEPREAARWSLQALSPGPGYVAALAVAGHNWRLKCWQWSLQV